MWGKKRQFCGMTITSLLYTSSQLSGKMLVFSVRLMPFFYSTVYNSGMQQIAKYWCWKWRVPPCPPEIVLSGLFLYWASVKTWMKATVCKFLLLREKNQSVIQDWKFDYPSLANSGFYFPFCKQCDSNQIARFNHGIQQQASEHTIVNWIIPRQAPLYLQCMQLKESEGGNQFPLNTWHSPET